MTGFLLAIQFFTVIPVNKELPMTKKHITIMFCSLPYIGVMMGGIAALLLWFLQNYMDFSSLLSGFLVMIVFVVMTGGLHLDGFVDMGDAFFSYRDIEKRQEILADPRIGAFGAMSLLFLVLAKLIILSELILKTEFMFYWLLFIPFLARVGMSFYLIQTPPARKDGIGAFFKEKIQTKPFIIFSLLSLAVGIGVMIWLSGSWLIPLVLVSITLVAGRVYRYWTLKNFKGSSGDLFGAFIEGMEAILWFSLLCLL